MARPDAVIIDLLAPLERSELARLAVDAWVAIEALPAQPLDSADGRLAAVEEQLLAVREAALRPLKLEVEALERLPAMAERLGIEGGVEVILPIAEDSPRFESLTDGRRSKALAVFIAAFDDALRQARAIARDREGFGE